MDFDPDSRPRADERSYGRAERRADVGLASPNRGGRETRPTRGASPSGTRRGDRLNKGRSEAVRPRYSFPKSARILSREDFQRVYREGRRVASSAFIVYYLPNGSDRRDPRSAARAGFCVSRKIGGAVRRNKIKRLLREAWRLMSPKIRPGFDVVINSRWSARDLDLDSAGEQLETALLEARLIKTPRTDNGGMRQNRQGDNARRDFSNERGRYRPHRNGGNGVAQRGAPRPGNGYRRGPAARGRGPSHEESTQDDA